MPDGTTSQGPGPVPGAPAQDTLVFTVSWAETDQRAGLVELRYNDRLVSEPRTATPGTITVAFRRPLAGIHRFTWDLAFPGRTLRELQATAALGGAAPGRLGNAGEAKDHWAAGGEL